MGSRKERPERSDEAILASASSMDLLQAIAAGQVIRGGGEETSIFAPYLIRGEITGRLALKLLRSDDLIRLPISGPPILTTRGTRLLNQCQGPE